MKEWKADGKYKGKFSSQVHFFGYEGRCAAPSNYDADYCYSLGYTAAALIGAGKTGYMSSVRNTTKTSDQWICGGIPITMMMNVERRHGEDKPVIQKALVKLDGAPFLYLSPTVKNGRSIPSTYIRVRSSISVLPKSAIWSPKLLNLNSRNRTE